MQLPQPLLVTRSGPPAECRRRVPRAVLAVGAALGLLLSLAGAVVPARPSSVSLPTGAAARVNDVIITTEELARARERLGGIAIDAKQRDKALAFLIDEELLVQRGIQMGLVESDRTVRKAIVMAMIDGIVAERLAREPRPDEVHAYYASHRAIFTRAARLHVRHMLFPASGSPTGAFTQAEEARAAVLAGTPFRDVRAQFGAQGSELPDGLVPVHVLRRYLGTALAELIEDLPADTVPNVIETSAGFHVVQVVNVQLERTPAFEEIADIVEREYLRRARDDALDAVLHDLRAKVDIAVAQDVAGMGATQWK